VLSGVKEKTWTLDLHNYETSSLFRTKPA